MVSSGRQIAPGLLAIRLPISFPFLKLIGIDALTGSVPQIQNLLDHADGANLSADCACPQGQEIESQKNRFAHSSSFVKQANSR